MFKPFIEAVNSAAFLQEQEEMLLEQKLHKQKKCRAELALVKNLLEQVESDPEAVKTRLKRPLRLSVEVGSIIADEMGVGKKPVVPSVEAVFAKAHEVKGFTSLHVLPKQDTDVTLYTGKRVYRFGDLYFELGYGQGSTEPVDYRLTTSNSTRNERGG